MNLHDLPKDLLIKMITEIREKTEKEMLDKQQKLISRIIHDVFECDGEYFRCDDCECDSHIFLDGDGTVLYKNNMKKCSDCAAYSCITHIEKCNFCE